MMAVRTQMRQRKYAEAASQTKIEASVVLTPTTPKTVREAVIRLDKMDVDRQDESHKRHKRQVSSNLGFSGCFATLRERTITGCGEGIYRG